MENITGTSWRFKLKLALHLLITVTGFISVILHVLYSPDPLVSLTKFTFQTNLMVSITFLCSSHAILFRKKQTKFLDFFKNASVIYMFVCIFTYHFLLASGGEYIGIRVITNFTLHYFIPIAVFINWLLFEPNKKYSYKFIFYWMIYPVLYCIISIVRGMFDGFYPYFFLNPNGEIPSGVGSYSNVAFFIAVFLFVYIILGFLLIILNRIFMREDNRKDVFDS
ncbi:Pr6Pr family membrane protein [Oceanobacillus neutriphilus]|uniref:Pr6Pr family membrane protein n=1 Tax=Oceanobacillus neutriphilus TaxID=531815 RepID=UPI00166345EC|nr:Pr6Pr family membrane protein [Oceanobacillus neutriphilus]